MTILLLIATITFYFLGLAINRVSGFKFQVSSNSLLTPKTLTVLGVVLGAGMLLYCAYRNLVLYFQVNSLRGRGV